MWEDPIVKETRKNRDTLVARFNYDLKELYRYLKEKECSSERTVRPAPAKADRSPA